MRQRSSIHSPFVTTVGWALLLAACSSSGDNPTSGAAGDTGQTANTGTTASGSSNSGGNGVTSSTSSGGGSGTTNGTSGSGGGSTSSGVTSGGRGTTSSGGSGTTSGGGSSTADSTSSGGGSSSTSGGQADAGGQKDGGQAGGGNGGDPGDGGLTSSCKGNAWPTADPSNRGTFQTTTDKEVGPLAGALMDPLHGNTQHHFNVYRPADLGQGGYCHPIILWSNGHGDQPEPGPDCPSGSCGHYLTLLNQLASHGFVVIASLSSITSQPSANPDGGAPGPLPSLVGMNWLIQQNDDPTSPYYHHLDTDHIGATGHSEGALATSLLASDPHVKAIFTIAGASNMSMPHGPTFFGCGGMDTTVPCSRVQPAFDAVSQTTTPVMMGDNLAATHGSWIGSIKDPYMVADTAWMRLHLMNDTAQRSMFYGPSCKVCTDTQHWMIQRKNMDQ